MAFLINPFSDMLALVTLTGNFGLVLFVIFMLVLSSFVWPYTINMWLISFGQRPALAWWHGCILGLWFNLDPFMIRFCLFTTVWFIVVNAVKQLRHRSKKT